jgi:MbtH protein
MKRLPDSDGAIYKILVNDEDQYSLWLDHRPNPIGWRDSGKSGSKAGCLAYIKDSWTDLRPKSLRERMDEERKD